MTKQIPTVDFAAPDVFGAHVFYVEIPAARDGEVRIVEDYGYKGGEHGLPTEEVRVILGRKLWTSIAEVARKDFNERLKEQNLKPSRWKVGVNKVDRLLGKELCILAWAVELSNISENKAPIICSKWAALRPEERWWLFSMTAAEGGLAEDSERGWRKALYHALSDGRVDTRIAKKRRKETKKLEEKQLSFISGIGK